MTEASFLVPAS